jgi:4-hydroxy-3-methylbut-2-enyl diphosphate reductase
MIVRIDPSAGFCSGVRKAIGRAEEVLDASNCLVSLGELVHNDEENERLRAKGLEPVTSLRDVPAGSNSILIRAHGEPPSIYREAREKDLHVIDATCPVVRKLQDMVRLAASEMESLSGTVVIYGKASHPEVIGLLGNAGTRAAVIQTPEGVPGLALDRPVRLFAQTTMDIEGWELIKTAIEKTMRERALGQEIDFRATNTICRQVSDRGPRLETFARQNDVMIFVSGMNSSNGRILFDVCKRSNPRSHWISKPGELSPEWFEGAASAGVSGATSTPRWLLEKVAAVIPS